MFIIQSHDHQIIPQKEHFDKRNEDLKEATFTIHKGQLQ